MPGPFDYIDAISSKNLDISRDPENGISGYVPWLTNRHFSKFPDTIMYASEANSLHALDKQLQHDYYLYSLRPRRRWTKWSKPSDAEEVALVSEWYGINMSRAREVLKLLPEEALKEMRRTRDDGRTGGDRDR